MYIIYKIIFHRLENVSNKIGSFMHLIHTKM